MKKRIFAFLALLLGIILVACSENTSNSTSTEAEKYTVTFYTNGGSSVATQTVKSGKTATEPATPSRDGFTFGGWYTDSALTSAFSFTTAITKDTTLYARWKKLSESKVFISGRNITVRNVIAEDHEVTQGEYETYCKYGLSAPDAPDATNGVGTNYPAYWVNWYDALVYCNKRSMAEGLTPCYSIGGSSNPASWPNIGNDGAGKLCGPASEDSAWNNASCDFTANGYRLPTEAEWEWLARGGAPTAAAWGYNYSGSDTVDDVAWTAGSGSGSLKTHEVKQKAANSKGLYDMSGNVSEWCWDWYGTVDASTPATGNTSGTNRVIRGGSYDAYKYFSVVSYRDDIPPHSRGYREGFRVVRTVQ